MGLLLQGPASPLHEPGFTMYGALILAWRPCLYELTYLQNTVYRELTSGSQLCRPD